jgi:hypothetical protein
MNNYYDENNYDAEKEIYGGVLPNEIVNYFYDGVVLKPKKQHTLKRNGKTKRNKSLKK